MSKVWKRDVNNVPTKLFLQKLKNIFIARYTLCFRHNYNYCDISTLFIGYALYITRGKSFRQQDPNSWPDEWPTIARVFSIFRAVKRGWIPSRPGNENRWAHGRTHNCSSSSNSSSSSSSSNVTSADETDEKTTTTCSETMLSCSRRGKRREIINELAANFPPPPHRSVSKQLQKWWW